ncbi:GTP-binding protein 10 isoform X1 [Engraulis encrasicolus]|uniref:GTP-binding protein 10 isoform X1 n=1 Tax=Engraulis encrasicolus TaxID=184585 RepID=UPI002FD47E7B
MVWLSKCCFRKYGNFVDHLRVYVKGGAGGMGLPRLGGQGGDGGDVWVVASKDYSLKKIKDKFPEKRFVARVGNNSTVRALKGPKGSNIEIPAPPGITVTDDNGKVLGTLNVLGDRVRVARGGRGGSFQTDFQPNKGQIRHVRMDLKLIADMGLVGFPNAGKSTLLSAISHAKPEIASYPFTTLKPEIGKVMFEDYKQVSVADLPGLIEGAHMNKGLGHRFLKHVERTKQLLFVVDVCGFQLGSHTPFRSAFQAVQLLTKELELYKEELLSKPVILVVNKMDLPEADEKLEELLHQLGNQEDYCHLLPEGTVPRRFPSFGHTVPVSASSGEGIPHLRQLLRQSLEEQEDQATESQRRDKLHDLRRVTSRTSSTLPRPAANPKWGLSYDA